MPMTILLQRFSNSSRKIDENFWILARVGDKVRCEYADLFDASEDDDDWDQDSFDFPYEDIKQYVQELREKNRTKLRIQTHTIAFEIQNGQLNIWFSGGNKQKNESTFTPAQLFAAFEIE